MGGIRAILKDLQGVLDYDVKYHFESQRYDVVLTYDERKTSLQGILDSLAQRGFSTEGKPEACG